jgi:hypothetical protein
MKLNAWADRRLPRDLADLYALHQRGLLDQQAVEITARAATVLPVHVFDDDNQPDQRAWTTGLAAQMRQLPDPDVAFLTVRAAVAAIRGWPEADVWSRQAAAHHP